MQSLLNPTVPDRHIFIKRKVTIMSYCVNCGVKLEDTLEKCPLCNTPVINPSELKKAGLIPPFPTERGETEKVKSKDGAILLTVAFATTAICCALLNYLVFNQSQWSIPIIGICAFFWVVFFPLILFKQLPVYAFIIMDGLAMAGYLYMLSLLTSSNIWLTKLALPITTLITAMILLLTFLVRNVSSSILAVALYVYILVPLLCIGIELLICDFRELPLRLVWSAVVCVPCAIVSIILITVLSKKRLREAVRRRLHF